MNELINLINRPMDFGKNQLSCCKWWYSKDTNSDFKSGCTV